MNILLTGASSGIGFETAKLLASDPKHTILVIARNASKLEALKTVNCIPFSFDLVNDPLEDLIAAVKKYLGTVHILINNAGTLINKPFSALNEGDWMDCYRTNVLAPVRLIQAMEPYFNSKGAHILNIGSMGGVQGSSKFPGLAAYSASKAALHNLSECLAEEWKERNIKVNALALGSAQTEMLEKAFPGYRAPVSAAEMAVFVADFAINGSQFFNGKILPVAISTP